MIIRVFLILLLVLPLSVSAEIYKWRDSNGTVRYSDTPPPSNVPHESIGAKKPATAPAASSEQIPATQAGSAQVPTGRESEAIKRQENAEKAQNESQAKEADSKQRQQNCIAAKSNMEGYKQGGRVSKTNEKGEREYMSDADFAKGKEQAQKEIDENCQ